MSNFCNRDSGSYVRGLPGVLCKDSPARDKKSERRRRMNCQHAEWSVATGGLPQKVCAIRMIIARFPNRGHRTFLREEEDTIGLRC